MGATNLLMCDGPRSYALRAAPEAARTGEGSADVQQSTLTLEGSTLAFSPGPYSAHVIQLTPRDRSLITCAALITNGSTEQLRAHLGIAKINGVTETELKEVIIHLAFYAGWPRAMSAIMVAKEVFAA